MFITVLVSGSKLSNKTIAGTYITLLGTAITLGFNYLLIPRFGYVASAWATFLCYGTMMVVSYRWGQKVYPIPYVTKKLLAYFVIVVLLFLIHKGVVYFIQNTIFSITLGAALLCAYLWFILLVEKKEFQKLPYIGKYIQ